MICQGCNNKEAYRTSTIFTDGTVNEVCDQCGEVGYFHVPDVFVDGKPEINLADDPATGKARVFTSRLAKERYLRDRKLVEVRGRDHGGPALPKADPPYNKEASKHQTMMALKHVREMGRDQRRQEYLRILNQRRSINGR